MTDKERIIDDYCDRTLGEFCFNLSPEEAIRLRDLLKNEEGEELKALFIMVDDAVNRK